MARPIQQIKQDLETLQKNVAETATELQQLYSNYLQVLSQSVKQQLMLAGYQLCTQIYPELFLKLSFSERQKLQQEIRAISQEIGEFLEELKNIEQSELYSEQTELNLLAEMIKNLPLNKLSNQESTADKQPLENQENLKNEEALPEIVLNGDRDNIQELAEHLESIAAEELDSDKSKELDLSNPEDLVLWQKKIEKNLKRVLNDTSIKANKSLQEAQILPKKLPPKIIDMAIQAHEASGNNHKVNGLPNIINLVVESDKDSKGKKTKVTQVSLLRLRLSEIEFIETNVSVQRNKIRNFSKKIQQLRKQYQAREKEYAIAEAEAAWRAGWYED